MPDHPPQARASCAARGLAAVALALGVAGGGCAKPAGVLFRPAETEIVWPAPPDPPRVRYLGELRSAEDLEAARGPLQQLGRAVFGAEAPEGFMVNPIDVCTDGADRVFIADPGARVVHVYDLERRRYEAWAPPGPAGALFQPTGLAWDPLGRLLVSDPGIAALYVFDARGDLLGTLGDGEIARPVGLAVDPDTRSIYIADAGAHRVLVLSPEDAVITTIGSRGTAPGQFNFPIFVALDGQGRLYVSDALNFRVQVFGPDGAFVRAFGEKGDMPGYLSQPKGLDVDSAGRILVVDANFEAVQIFGEEGEILMAFGHEGRRPGEFWLPVGLEINGAGRIWVADSYNRRVQLFEMIAGEVAP